MPKISNKKGIMEMKKEEKYYQIYRIHLLNGEVIEASEEYSYIATLTKWLNLCERRTHPMPNCKVIALTPAESII